VLKLGSDEARVGYADSQFTVYCVRTVEEGREHVMDWMVGMDGMASHLLSSLLLTLSNFS
jgi:hypothetical protein